MNFGDTLDDGRIIFIKLLDCKGKSMVTCYKGKTKVEEGAYCNSLDLLKRYTTSVNGVSLKSHIRVYEYYQPLRNGIWQFYDQSGKNVTKRVMYNKGVEVKNENLNR